MRGRDMESISKHQARVVQEDRISALPKALICHILSFLPTIEAVRTTVLSKRWNNMWTCVTTLDFHVLREDDDYGCRLFDKFVNRVLFFRDSSDILKFKLSICPPHSDYSSCIDDWICTAVRRNLVELELHIYFQWVFSKYGIPRSLFTCKTLRVLKLVSDSSLCLNWQACDPPTSGCFPSLKFLHVTVDCPDNSLMENLFCCCPVLEVLIIDGVTNHKDLIFNVSAPELKRFSICLDECGKILVENSFNINAPNVESLDLDQVALSHYKLDNMKSLVNASISFTFIPADKCLSFQTSATALLAGISNVRYLSLSTYSFDASYLPAAFINLKKLDLLLHECNYWELLAELLCRAPNLEDIVVEDKTKCYKEYSELPWNPPRVVPICLSSHLKTISIKGFKALRVEMELAKYLLKSGYFLNKMTLYTGFLFTDAEELYKEFFMFHRAMTCQVKFIKM